MDTLKLRELAELREMRSAVITNETQFYELSNLLWPKLHYLNHIVSVKSSKQSNRSSTIRKLKYLSESLIKKTRETHFLRSEVTLLQKTRDSLNEFIIQQAAVIAGFNSKNNVSCQYSDRRSCQRQKSPKKETAASKVLIKARKCRKKNVSHKENIKNEVAQATLCDQFLDDEAADDDSFNEIIDNIFDHPEAGHLKAATEKSPNVFVYNVHKVGVKTEPLSDCEQEFQSSAISPDSSMRNSFMKESDSTAQTSPSTILNLKDIDNMAPSLVERPVANVDNSDFSLAELFDQKEQTNKIMEENSDIFNCISSQMSSLSY